MSDEKKLEAGALTAAFDQFRSAGREFAAVMATYRQALIENGVPEEDALQLTMAYQGTVLLLAVNANQEGEGG